MIFNLTFKKINIIIASMLALAAMIIPSIPALAEPVKVELEGTGSTSWTIGPVVPGASGVQEIRLHNAGDKSGLLNIWISNISGKEGTPLEFQEKTLNTTGDLSRYLLLNLSGDDRLTSTFSKPATINSFPDNISKVNFIGIPILAKNETISLIWQWQIPPEVGNDIQGDTLSFDINYTLTDPTPNRTPGGGGSGSANTTIVSSTTPLPTPSPNLQTSSLELDLPDSSSAAIAITTDGIIAESLSLTTKDRSFGLSIDNGTRVLISDRNNPGYTTQLESSANIPQKIIVSIPEVDSAPPVPEGWIQVSPFFDINGIKGGIAYGVKMDRAARIVIGYDTSLLPELLDSLATFYYNPESGWTQLQVPQGFIAEAGQNAAEVDHFSLFVVLAKSAEIPVVPARIEIQELTLEPSRILVGQSTEIQVKAQNSGGISGEKVIKIKANGIVKTSQSITLLPGETGIVTLVLKPETIGTYMIEAGQFSENLMVDPITTTEVTNLNYWWVVLISTVLAVLITFLFKRKRSV
jgi:hypothetical protein